jgi:hypothetical protein
MMLVGWQYHHPEQGRDFRDRHHVLELLAHGLDKQSNRPGWARAAQTVVTLSWLTSGGGIRSGATVTITLAKGACPAHLLDHSHIHTPTGFSVRFSKNISQSRAESVVVKCKPRAMATVRHSGLAVATQIKGR